MSEGRALSARHLDWQACYNVRDLGGLPLTGGGKTRWGSIVRADLLARLTPAGRGAMLAYGVRTVIDLRGPHEVKEEPTIRGEPGGSRSTTSRWRGTARRLAPRSLGPPATWRCTP